MYKQLTSEQRSQIFAYLQDGIARKIICERVGISQSTFRQYFPKGTDFRTIEQSQFDYDQAKINRRPREKLNFSTPLIEFFKLLS